ncbi:MAG: ABC transporter permease subunit [Gemmatimonadetes bacterium]|nr:ABC transporter permease subunit [Gemmatimonadota bacterium]
MTARVDQGFPASIRERNRSDRIVRRACAAAAVVALAPLVLVAVHALWLGAPHLTLDFFLNAPSSDPASAGIRPLLLGTVWMVALVGLVAVPLSVGSAVYLDAYFPQRRLARILGSNIGYLASVPSVVYGLVGLAVFARGAAMGHTLLAGAATLTLLVLPLLTRATREVVRAVPRAQVEAAYALGATPFQAIRFAVLPGSAGQIAAASLRALSRAAGETAPLVVLGAFTFIALNVTSPLDPLTALPVQVFEWTESTDARFRGLAGAAALVLLAGTLLLNAGATLVHGSSIGRR